MSVPPPNQATDASSDGSLMAPVEQAEFDAIMQRLRLLPESRVVLACSGGPDSMALAVLLKRWGDANGRVIHALIVNHGLRTDAADEAARVAGWLGTLGIPNTVLSYDGVRPESDIQAAAREIRYRLIFDWMAQEGDAALFLAHHLDDQAETFLLRLGRGSGVDGLSAMAHVTTRGGITLFRPLLRFPKERLKATVIAVGIAFVDDPSNLSDAFARVRIRKLMGALSAEGLTADRLAGTAMRMARARDALEAVRNSHIARHVTIHPAGYALSDLEALLKEPEDIGLRVVSVLIRVLGGRDHPPREAHVIALLRALRDDGDFAGRTLAGVAASSWRNSLLLCREAAAIAPSVALADGIRWDGRFECTVQTGGEGLTVGALGDDGLRAAKDRAPDALNAIPAIVRPTLPALWSDKELVAIPHLGIAPPEGLVEGELALRVPITGSGGEKPFSVPFSNTSQDLI